MSTKKIIILIILLLPLFTFAQLPPAKPTITSANQVGLTNSINVNWGTSATAIGYKVYFKEGTTTTVTKVGVVNTLTQSNLKVGTSYNIYIIAFRLNAALTDTLFSPQSDPVITPMIELVAPVITAEPQYITQNAISVRLVDSNLFETGFEIEFESGAGKEIKTATAGTILFLPFSGFTPKTIYTIRARAIKDASKGPWSASIAVTTIMDVPPIPEVAISLNCPQIVTLDWKINSRPEDIGSFKILRSFDNVNFNNYGEVAPWIRNYTDFDASPGKSIFYKVVAINTTGITQSSSALAITPNYVAPISAINIQSDKTNKTRNSLNISWTLPSEDLVCKTNLRKETIVQIKLANEDTYKDYAYLYPNETKIKIEGLNPKDIVDVAVIYKSDKNLFSSRSVVRDTTAGPPYTPSNLIILDGIDALNNNYLELKWKDESKDEDYFIIERSLDNKTFSQIGKITYNITNFIDLNIEQNVIYYYRIKAGSNTQGESQYTSTVFGIINAAKMPTAPYGLIAKANGSKINLTWYDDSINEENFVIEKSIDNGISFTLVATLGKNTQTYTDENNVGGKTYQYRVKATNKIGSSTFSNVAIVSTPASGFINLGNSSINIYPNPTSEFIKIKLPESNTIEMGRIILINKENRIIKNQEITIDGSNEFELKLNGLETGIYTLLISNQQSSISKKIYIF